MECPYCKEDIKEGAIKCKHCGSMLDGSEETTQIKAEVPKSNEEKVFFNAGDKSIKVTNSRFITSGQTYSLANISSVKTGYEDQNIAAWICMIIGLATLVWGIGILFIGISIWLFKQKFYKVIINTSGGETDALSMKDGAMVRKIVDKLNEAIMYRG